MAGNSALNTTTPPRIAIIGGGTAGLTCAYRLAQAGVNATIYESRALARESYAASAAVDEAPYGFSRRLSVSAGCI